MWLLTVETPDLSISQRDNIAEIRPWLNAYERINDAASVPLRSLPPTRWLRDLWLDVEKKNSREQTWSFLPDKIVDLWSRGQLLTADDLAFLARVAHGDISEQAVAATRTLGLLIDAQPALEGGIVPLLETSLKHTAPEIRAAAAEAIWIANAKGSVGAIQQAAAVEPVASVKAYMVHAAQLLAAG